MQERYSRQMRFKPIGEKGQKRLMEQHVLIIGCGALGSANAESLTRAGIGKLTLIDRDYVDESNLQRQQLYSEEDAEKQTPKAIAAQSRLQKINSNTVIAAHVIDATAITLLPFLKDIDLVIDSTDNFDTRFMLNDLLHQQQIAWIFGSCAGSTGMSYTIMPNETPCLQCLLGPLTFSGATCDAAGIISPAVQMAAAHQTTEAMKILVGDRKAMRTKLVMFDLWNNQYQMIDVERARKRDCPTCGIDPSYPFLNSDSRTKTEILCGRNTVQIRSARGVSLDDLSKKLIHLKPMVTNEFLLSIEYESYRIVFFSDGRTLIHGTNSIEKAKRIYYQLVG
ncbi:ThiF family adenylyltransferase [Oceanobacillus massiliensis]|uniref:ThiF family adenylyltransferase n=1 Tax=Oceanobacillus massiliensis TaxID=1465765 RepID=UPI0002883569|nr:ThiF family adenylyltransferase [Oceanobacillus massiliensis]